ncbi:FAD-dependent oxidoreductase [Chloroflexota bacterium]
MDSNWDKTADVVIIGYGLAGVVSAITAHDAGSEVLILDKMPQEKFHSSSSMSGGIFISTSDVKKTIQYMEGLNLISNRGVPTGDIMWTEPEITQVWAEYTADNAKWMQNLGANISLRRNGGEHPTIPGCESIERWVFAGSGFRMMNFLYDKVSERKIEVRHSTRAKKLLTNLKGEVIGVKVVTAEGQERDIGAHKAVILACGGFEYNEPMKMQYLKVYPAYFMGPTSSTGDGIVMAQEVGADLWHMNCVAARIVLKFPECPWAFLINFSGRGMRHRAQNLQSDQPEAAGYIMVDRFSNRFTSENIKGHAVYYELGLFDTQRLEYPRIPCYSIFDQRRIDGGILTNSPSGAAGPHQLYKWSSDNSKEIEQGWIVTAKTVRELAGKLDLPADNLQRTVDTYNRYCSQGKDTEFNRRPETLAPLDKGPFYACRLWPGGPNTQGGPRRNALSQILNTDGDPISGLYGGGELGSVFGMLYPSGGGNLGECIAFGRVAGENAAREKPRRLGSAW